MQSLVILVEEAYTHRAIGRATVDIRLLDVKHPISGTFPLLIPRDDNGIMQAGGTTSEVVRAASGSLSTDIRHVGTLDLHLELGFSSSNVSSFEMNEHLASQVHHSGGMISHPPVTFPSKSRDVSHHEAVGDFEWEMGKLDLFELLLSRLLQDFKAFCEVFYSWKESTSPFRISDLLLRMQSHRVFHYDIKWEQMQYLQVMVDPKGDMGEMSIDDFILAVRQSVEAGVRVRSSFEMQPVMMMLAPLAQNIQQSLLLLRQAFRDSSFEGESGLMTMEALSSVLQELLPPFKTQQLRYFLCILAHQGSSRRPGIISFQDLQAFLRMSSFSGKGAESTANAMADSESPADVAESMFSGALEGEAKPLAGRFGKDPGALVKPVVKKGALDRLKERLKDQRPHLSSVGIKPDQEAEHTVEPLLQPFPPPLPVFLDINPPLPTQPAIQPAVQVMRVAGLATSVVSSDALDLLIKKAEALQNSLAEAALGKLERQRMEGENETDRLSMLQFVSDPDLALNFAQDVFMLRANIRVEEINVEDEAEVCKEQNLLHHLFFPASVDASLDLTEITKAESIVDHPDQRIEGGGLINVPEETEEVVDALVQEAAREQAAKPGLHITIQGALLPEALRLDTSLPATLSLVIRSSCLMPCAHGIHWPLSKQLGSEGQNPANRPLLTLTLPIQDNAGLPCQVLVELWSERNILIGVSQVSLVCNETPKQASARGLFPMKNPLLSPEEEDMLALTSHFKIEARIALQSAQLQNDVSPLLSMKHTFRVTVCQAIEMNPHSSSQPISRFVSYLFPGDAEPLCTEEVNGINPIFAASVAHSVTLVQGRDVASKLIDMAREAQLSSGAFDGKSLLEFSLWEKWSDDTEHVLSASTSLPLSSLAELGFASRSMSEAGLCASVGTFATLHLNETPGDSSSQLLVQLQYDLAPSVDPPEVEMNQDEAPIPPDAPALSPAKPMTPRYSALFNVDIIQATGLMAAVLDAQAWLGSSAALLGRSHLTGPSPFVTLDLISGGPLKERLPRIQTPFLVHSFCPRFNHHSQLELPIDSLMLEALATQHLCIELWHHTSRALVAEADMDGAKSADIFLGHATCPLSAVLLKPVGIRSWLVIKSKRGEPVGAVELAVSIEALKCHSKPGGQEDMIHPLEACSDAPPPLMQHPVILAGPMLPPAARDHLMGLAPWAFAFKPRSPVMQDDPPDDSASDGIWPSPPSAVLSCHLPHGFGGQWSRLTIHLDQLVLPLPGVAAEFRPKAYKYYASYKLPGAYNIDIETSAQSAKAQQFTASSASSVASNTWVVPLSHCGIHWVRADSSLAAALARAPLLLRVFRVYGKTTGLLAAKPSLLRDETSETWLSCTLIGECSIDLSSMISASAIRKHQPNTRWLSGTFGLIEPEAKLYVSNRVQVRALMELLPSTLPPLSWLSKSAWQPLMPHNPAPLLDPKSTGSGRQGSCAGQLLLETDSTKSGEAFIADAREAETQEAVYDLERAEIDCLTDMETTAPSQEQPAEPLAQADDLTSFHNLNLNDHLFSFAKGDDEVPDATLCPVELQSVKAPEENSTVHSESAALSLVPSSLSPRSPLFQSVNEDTGDMDSDKVMLRTQLQELEMISLNFLSRFDKEVDESLPVEDPVSVAPSEGAALADKVVHLPRVDRTCSEDGDDVFVPVLGIIDSGSSDTDDTDELLARRGLNEIDPGIQRAVNAPTLFSSALDPNLIFSFSRPKIPNTSTSRELSKSAFNTLTAPQFMPFGMFHLMGQELQGQTQEQGQDDFSFSPTLHFVQYDALEPAEVQNRFVFSNTLPLIQPDFKLEYS